MSIQSVEPSQTYDFADALGGKEILRYSVGPAGDAILLAIDQKYLNVAQGRTIKGASFAHSLTRQPYPATIVHHNAWDVIITEIPEVTVAHPHIQPLDDGRILIVAARCLDHDGKPEENAVVYDADGAVERRMVFGDGIESVQVSSKKQIWVSYFDEGIFGNRGWNDPLGETGLVCFDLDGHVAWRFLPPAGFDFICDCYVMNVARNAVWVCYYTDFPIVKISSDYQMQGWSNEIAGASALAIDGGRVLLWGGYGKNRNRCMLQTISDDRLVSPTPVNLLLPDNGIPEPTFVIGRGSILHVFQETLWSQFDVRHITW